MQSSRFLLAVFAATLLSSSCTTAPTGEGLSADDIWASAKRRAHEKVAEGDIEAARRILANAKELIAELGEGDSRLAAAVKDSPDSVVVFVLEDGTMYLDGTDRPLDPDALRKAVCKGLTRNGESFSVRVFADATVRHGAIRTVFDVCAEAGMARVGMDRRGIRGRLIRKDSGAEKKTQFFWAIDPAPLNEAVYGSWSRPANGAGFKFGLERIDTRHLDEIDWLDVLRPSPGDGFEPLPDSPEAGSESAVPRVSPVRSPIVFRLDPAVEQPTVSIGKPRGETPFFFTFNGKRATEQMLSDYFGKIGQADPERWIVFNLTNEAPNGLLLRALELAAEQGLDRLAIFSLDTPEPPSSEPMPEPTVAMRGVMGARNPGQQGKALSRYGAGGGDAVVMRALRWLKKVHTAAPAPGA